jgi:hypothetical protein
MIMSRQMLPVLLALLLVSSVAHAQESADQDEAARNAELAKQSQNPVANMISIPFEFWHFEGENGKAFSGIVKPVIPTPVGGMNLINRFILPYASISGTMEPPGQSPIPTAVDAKGLADMTYQGFLSPRKPGSLIWGGGVALTIPTGSDDLSTDRWSAGPSVLLLTMPGKWVVGLVAQNVWDFAGSGDTDVNKLTLQPILSYSLGTGWYLTSTPVITADWTAEPGEEWTVPLGMGVGRLQKIGKLPVDIKLVYYNYVVKPTLGPDWSAFLGVKFLLPKG